MLKSIFKLFAVPNVDKYDRNVHYLVAVLVLTVTLYDILVLGISFDFQYASVRFGFIVAPFLFSFIMSRRTNDPCANEFLIFNYFTYSAYYSYFYSYAYIFSFAQFALGMAGILKISRRAYTPLLIYGGVLAYVCIFYSPQFQLRNNEAAIKADYLSSIVYIFVVSFFVFHRSLKQKEQALTQELVFANIGKRVSVVLHELQGTLRRFDKESNLSEFKEIQDLRDINKLLSILSPKSTSQHDETISLEDVKELVEEVIVSQKEYIEYLGIDFSCSLHSHSASLDKISFKIALKNLIKNAIEELIQIEKGRRYLAIELTSQGQGFELTIKNNSRSVQAKPSDLLKPFVSHKSNITNSGLGLYIVDTLCKRMNLKLNLGFENRAFWVQLVDTGQGSPGPHEIIQP